MVQYTSPGVESVGHNEQPGEPFGKIAQRVQVNAQPATKDFTGGTNQKEQT